jgi:glucans biosynthesis protein
MWRRDCSVIARMLRRRFLQTGAALAAAAVPWPEALPAEAAHPSSLKRLGPAAPFDYAKLKGMARTMANAAYQAPPSELPPAIAKMSWDQWQSIRFRDDHSLWFGEGLRFST